VSGVIIYFLFIKDTVITEKPLFLSLELGDLLLTQLTVQWQALDFYRLNWMTGRSSYCCLMFICRHVSGLRSDIVTAKLQTEIVL